MLFRLLTDHMNEIALFKYITFRASMAAITALFICFALGRPIINIIRKLNMTERIREDGPHTHKIKEGTPTMGGIIMMTSLLSGVLLWADLSNPFIKVLIFSSAAFALTGLIDDIIKRRDKKGLVPVYKIVSQLVISLGVALFVMKGGNYGELGTFTNIVVLKNYMLNLSFLYIPFIFLVILGSTNGVNLTDGLDGLASGLSGIVFAVFTVIAYIAGNMVFSRYLNMMYIPEIGEASVFLLAASASSLGFLWFNSNPAEIFMGDTGALALGGIMGTAAVLVKQEILLLVAGGVFAAEALSSLLQIAYFKTTGGKRLFRMAPLHHHYEKCGIPENKIVTRFWIIGILLGILALSTMKMR